MLRGIYTSATGMIMNQEKLNLIANNIANTNQTAFKEDIAINKSFPQMLIQRTREDGLGITPIGSFDLAAIVGRLGTGVEFNESYTKFTQGGAQKTDNPLDLMIMDQWSPTQSQNNGDIEQEIAGYTEGRESTPMKRDTHFLTVRAADARGTGEIGETGETGEHLTRNGSFTLNREGFLVTQEGRRVQGENGDIQLLRHNFIINGKGEVWINQNIGNQLPDAASSTSNDWENPVLLDRLKIQTVASPRHLEKIGDSLYKVTLESGLAVPTGQDNLIGQATSSGFSIKQGFLERSNVNLVEQMIEMINTQRNYEANQKSVVSQDQLLGKLINEVSG